MRLWHIVILILLAYIVGVLYPRPYNAIRAAIAGAAPAAAA
jgi:hypothetical protein